MSAKSDQAKTNEDGEQPKQMEKIEEKEKDVKVEKESTLTDEENQLIKAVSEQSLEKVVDIVSNASSKVNINCKDEHGMSPLQHACYKGNVPIGKFLIERGADVNQNDHEHRYSSLMFAALGGHVDCINMLLENGANVSATNSVGRTASQMAAFVGQHQSVAAINNYIPCDQIEYYSKLNGLEKEPRLSMRFIPTVHALVCLSNINPVRVAYFFENHCELFEEKKKISNVLEHLCEKLFRSSEPNEILSLKVHYLNFIFTHLHKALEKHRENLNENSGKDKNEEEHNKENKPEPDLGRKQIKIVIHKCIKCWLQPNSKGFPENMERLLREAIRSYPYKENSLFQQYVRTLSTVEIGDEPTALSILTKNEDYNTCYTCSETKPNKRCSKCKVAIYCNETCQRFHWPIHKLTCSPPSAKQSPPPPPPPPSSSSSSEPESSSKNPDSDQNPSPKPENELENPK